MATRESPTRTSKDGLRPRLRHLAYTGGWKKFEPLWDLLIRTKQVLHTLPVLETILTGFGSRPANGGAQELQIPSRADLLPVVHEVQRESA